MFGPSSNAGGPRAGTAIPRKPRHGGMMSTTSSSIDSARKQSSSVCPICHGAGFLRRDVPVDHPDFGRAIPCEGKQREVVQAELTDLRASSGLAHLSRMTFETFRPDGIGLNPAKRKNLH